ncbi:MAG: hypothetical protein BWY58_00484 [Chloroflexi bacterium ADurb.Bin344]|nr:MAG: hypothetical protein BWY58_00484 [Chloroflexi bacterium ADurb.Bin344]
MDQTDQTNREQEQPRQKKHSLVLATVVIFIAFAVIASLMIYFNRDHPAGVIKTANYLVAIIFFILFVISIGLTFIIVKVIQRVDYWLGTLPQFTKQANLQIESLRSKVAGMSDDITEPIITAEAKFRALHDLFKTKKPRS